MRFLEMSSVTSIWCLLMLLGCLKTAHAAFVSTSPLLAEQEALSSSSASREEDRRTWPFQKHPFVSTTHLHANSEDASSVNGKNDADADSSSSVDVVLFGVGDLRVDDHVGLMRAIENQNENAKILPLCILNDDSLQNIPGAVAHTADTAKMLSAALTDLQASLQDDLGLPLHVVWDSKSNDNESISDTIADLVKDGTGVDASSNSNTIRIHVCDLGEADNQLAYGPYSQLMNSDSENVEIVTWTNDLRHQPWEKVDSLPRSFPDYQRMYENAQRVTKPKSVTPPSSLQPLNVVSLAQYTDIPTAEQLTSHLTEILQLDPARVMAEANTGLYMTHWGGLQPKTIGCQSTLDIVKAYVEECQEKDEVWTLHPLKPGRSTTRNGFSLEHAAMHWQLQGPGEKPAGYTENWMAGEAMVRYLAAPLLFGTVSPRRLHDVGLENKIYYASPLKIMVEAREWHRLLAAHHIRNHPDYQEPSSSAEVTSGSEDKAAKTHYRYWRYHGFLCRYAVTDAPPQQLKENVDDKEGLLMVHGFGASGAQWNKMLQDFMNNHAANDDSVQQQGLAPDLLGFGESEKPAISYTGYMWDSQVADFAKEQALNKNRHACKSFVTGGNSIGGFTSMSFAACDTASIKTNEEGSSAKVAAVSSSGAPGTGSCTGLVLMNSAGPIFTKQEIDEVIQESTNYIQECSVAQITAMDALPECKPPPRPAMRAFGNGLLASLRPSVQSICKNLYPTNPDAVDDVLCEGILRDSLDPGAIYVMMAGAKLPTPRSANELLNADFRAGTTQAASSRSAIAESTFDGPVLVAQGVLDPLNDCQDRMERLGALRPGVDMDPINAGHCPHDELPDQVAASISNWMMNTKEQRQAFIKASSLSSSPAVTSSMATKSL